MSDMATNIPDDSSAGFGKTILRTFRALDKAWLFFLVVVLAITVFIPDELIPTLRSTFGNLAHTSLFIAFAVATIAWLRATGAEAIVGRAFQGSETTMICLAALVGGIAPFCSCEVVPFIAAMLAMGTPISAVMAFWLSSPIMDPPMFVITASALGLDFAIAKTVAAIAFGLFGGFSMLLLSKTTLFDEPLRASTPVACGSGCGSSATPFSGAVVWAFWTDSTRLRTFFTSARENAMFLLKWLAVAYLLESLMIRFVPAEWIGAALGGDGLKPIGLGALLGGPAYLNGYAAVPLVKGLLVQGMSQGAAMSFVLAGSVTCIPAAIAVWALVKPRVFLAYIAFGLSGAFAAGLIWSGLN